MYLSSVAVHNFKCFKDTGPVVLRPGFNFIGGPNNSGKTALLEALSLAFGFMPFRDESFSLEDRSQTSTVQVDFKLESSELGPLLHRPGIIRLPKLAFPQGSDLFLMQNSDPGAFLKFLTSEDRTFSFRQDANFWVSDLGPSVGFRGISADQRNRCNAGVPPIRDPAKRSDFVSGRRSPR